LLFLTSALISIFSVIYRGTQQAPSCYVRVRHQRTRVDFAFVVKELCDELYPDAKKIILVMDNLNTHETASLYEAFEPEQARRLVEKLEIHHTPKHGS